MTFIDEIDSSLCLTLDISLHCLECLWQMNDFWFVEKEKEKEERNTKWANCDYSFIAKMHRSSAEKVPRWIFELFGTSWRWCAVRFENVQLLFQYENFRFDGLNATIDLFQFPNNAIAAIISIAIAITIAIWFHVFRFVWHKRFPLLTIALTHSNSLQYMKCLSMICHRIWPINILMQFRTLKDRIVVLLFINKMNGAKLKM